MSTVFVGVLRLGVVAPGARSLKDRRQALVSVRDRVRKKFEVTFNELPNDERPDRTAVVCTTAGIDSRAIRSVLDRIADFVADSGRVVVTGVDIDVFPWHPPEPRYDPDHYNRF